MNRVGKDGMWDEEDGFITMSFAFPTVAQLA